MSFLVAHVVALLVGDRVITLWVGLQLKDWVNSDSWISQFLSNIVRESAVGEGYRNEIPF